MNRERRTGIWAVVPVKTPGQSKQRLAGIVDGNGRRRLSLAMLADVLTALRSCLHIDRILVISSDWSIQQSIAQFDVQVIMEKATGTLSTAIDEAYRHVESAGADGLLIVHSDLPLISIDTLEKVLHVLRKKPSVIIGPDRSGTGTNLLGLCPIRPFSFHYGPDSFQAHCREAVSWGVEPAIIHAEDIALDIDTPECLNLFMHHLSAVEKPSYTSDCIKWLRTTGHLRLAGVEI